MWDEIYKIKHMNYRKVYESIILKAFSENRKKIYDLLTSKGYNRKYVGLSKWDDWYFMEL